MSEQPTQCPICLTRTDLVADFAHTNFKGKIEECLNWECKYLFIEQEDLD